MEITRHLRLDQPDGEGRVAIHLRVCWQGNKVRFSSKEKVKPDEWDDGKGRVKGRVQFSADINARLDTYETGIRRFSYKNDSVVLTPDMIRAEVDRIRAEELGIKSTKSQSPPVTSPIVVPELPTLQEFVPRYVREKTAERSKSWRDTVPIVAAHLNAFRPGVNWDGLTLSTLNLFKVYLQEEEELSDATISAYVYILKGLLKYAGRSLPVLPDYTYLEVRPPGDRLQPELQQSEIFTLMNAQLDAFKFVKRSAEGLVTQSKSFSLDDMELTRWYFTIACHTGLRHSDLWMIQSPKIAHIENIPCLEIHQRKTTDAVAIPLSDDVYHMIRNPPSKTRPAIRTDYNPMLKVAGRFATLDRAVRVGTYYHGQLISEVLPLHETMSSHMARRTFATLMTAGGMPTKTLQEIMGHSAISSTEKYTKVSNPMIVQQTIDAWKRSKGS